MRKRLGDMLLEAGLISEVQLNASLSDQQVWGGPIGNHLIKMGAITEEELVSFLSKQLNLPRIDFKKSTIHKDALALLPRKICEKWSIIPVAFKEQKGHRQLLLAMSNPTNLEAVSEVEFLTGISVQIVVASEQDIQVAIGYCYSVSGLRDSEGLKNRLIAENRHVIREEPIVILSGGEEFDLDSEEGAINFDVVRALLELLYEKNIITPEELHHKLDQIERGRK